MSDENIVFIGNKPVMNYVLAVITQVNNGTKNIYLKARGRSISRAVDVAEIVRNKFVPTMELGNINISTEEVTDHNGNNLNVSVIEIELIN